MSEENKRTKYRYNDLFSRGLFTKYKVKDQENVKLNLRAESEDWQEICSNLGLPDKNILQILDMEFNSLYQSMNEPIKISEENIHQNFDKIGKTSDAYQKAINTMSSFIQQVTQKENYKELVNQSYQEAKKLEKQIEDKSTEITELEKQVNEKYKKVNELSEYAEELTRKKNRLQTARFIFFRRRRLANVSTELKQIDIQLQLANKELNQTSTQLQLANEELEQTNNQLNEADEILIQTNKQFIKHQKTLNLIPKLSHKLIQLYENKVYLDNLSYNMLNAHNTEMLNKETSINKILSSKENTVPYVERNSNSETYSGEANTVYSTEDENGDKKFVKPGQIFYTAPEDMQNISFNQTKAMRYLPENKQNIKPGESYYVDSPSRQSVENFPADMLGFGKYFVRTKPGIDKTGKVSVMDEAEGIPGSQVLLYKQSDKEKLEQFLNTNISENIAIEINEKDENGNSKLVIKKANNYKDLFGNHNWICATKKTQLSALVTGIVDFICAQSDRHFDNFFVNKNGEITNIDNDAICIQDNLETDTRFHDIYLSKMMKAKIPFLTPELKKNFMDFYNNKDIFFNFLKGKMNIGLQGKAPILVIEERLKFLYDYVNNKCPIVEQFDENSFDRFLQAHKIFEEYYGENKDLVLTQSNPIALVSCPCSKEYIDDIIDKHFSNTKTLLNDKLSNMQISDSKWVQKIVNEVARNKIDNLMLQYQIGYTDTIQLVIEPMVKCIQNNQDKKYSKQNVENAKKNLFTELDNLAQNKFAPSAVHPFGHLQVQVKPDNTTHDEIRTI